MGASVHAGLLRERGDAEQWTLVDVGRSDATDTVATMCTYRGCCDGGDSPWPPR